MHFVYEMHMDNETIENDDAESLISLYNYAEEESVTVLLLLLFLFSLMLLLLRAVELWESHQKITVCCIGKKTLLSIFNVLHLIPPLSCIRRA